MNTDFTSFNLNIFIQKYIHLIFFGILAILLIITRGDYKGEYILLLLITYILLAKSLLKKKPSQIAISNNIFIKTVALLYFIFTLGLAIKPNIHRKSHKLDLTDIFSHFSLTYSDPDLLYIIFRILLFLLFLTSVIQLIIIFKNLTRNSKKLFVFLTWSFILILFCTEILLLFVSPKPWIDLFTNSTQAVDYFVSGINPYLATYPDIYDGLFGEKYPSVFGYWPGLLYWITPFRYFLGDIRFGYIFSDLISLVFILLILRKKQFNTMTRYLILLLWFSFPIRMCVLESAWIDSILIMFSILICWSILEKKIILIGIFLGFLCTVKQYAIFVPIVTVAIFLANGQFKNAIKISLFSILTFFIVMFPMLIWDWEAFYKRTISGILDLALRPDAFSINAWLFNRFKLSIPKLLNFMLYVIYFALIIYWIIRKRENSLFIWSVALTLMYGMLFLFGKYAFVNYYYFLAIFAFLYIIFCDQIKPELHTIKQ